MKNSFPNSTFQTPFTTIAHRGASGITPENTITAFETAIEKFNFDSIELDVHCSKDGEILVIHDETLERTTDGQGLVKEKTLQSLKSLDAGYRFTPEGETSCPYRGKELRIPTLAEVLDRFPNTKLNIELKQRSPSVEERFISVIREQNREKDVIIGSHNYTVSHKLKKIAPEITSFFSRRDVLFFYTCYKTHFLRFHKTRHSSVQITPRHKNKDIITPEFVKAVHEKNLKLHAWTINDEDMMERLIKFGVDGIMTDYPDRLNRVLGKMRTQII